MRDKNSLSQSLTVLPAPSGREPLAWRESFWLKGKAFCPGVPLPSCRFASSHLPQGDGFSSGGKVSGIAIRRPLGGAGCERSEQTEGVIPHKKAVPKRPQAFRNCNNKGYFPLICPPAAPPARLSGRADGSPLRQRSRPRAARTGRWRSPRPGGRADSAAPARPALRFPADGR